MNEELASHFTHAYGKYHLCSFFFSNSSNRSFRAPQDAVDEMVSEFKKRRDFLVKALNQIPGISCKPLWSILCISKHKRNRNGL